jgi:Xaa-Pro aminopeptidase
MQSVSAFAARRDVLLSMLQPGEGLLFLSTPTVFSAPGVPFPHSQDSSFLYLTGREESNLALGMFRPADPVLDADTDTAASLSAPQPQIALFRQNVDSPQHTAFWGLQTPLNPSPFVASGVKVRDMSEMQAFFEDAGIEPQVVPPHAPGPFSIDMLRATKEQCEVDEIRQACTFAQAAMAGAIKDTIGNHNDLDAVTEHDLAVAYYARACRLSGRKMLPFPPVVAHGPHALTVHHIDHNATTPFGAHPGLLQLDFGAYSSIGRYASDLSRVLPLRLPTEQEEDIYRCLLQARQAGLARLADGAAAATSLADVHNEVCETLAAALGKVGIFEDASRNGRELDPAELGALFPHAAAHHVGLCVHDAATLPPQFPLLLGNGAAVVAVEPGLYLREGLGLKKEFEGIGMRIEDTVAVSGHGVDILSDAMPGEGLSVAGSLADARAELLKLTATQA